MNKKEYAKEVGMVAAIIADTITKPLYEKTQIGYIAVIEQISDWAAEFVEKHKNTNWEEILEKSSLKAISNEFNKKQKLTTVSKGGGKKVGAMEIICWDDAVIDFAYYKLETYE